MVGPRLHRIEAVSSCSSTGLSLSRNQDFSILEKDKAFLDHRHQMRQHLADLLFAIDRLDHYWLLVRNPKEALAMNAAVGAISHDPTPNRSAGDMIPVKEPDNGLIQPFSFPSISVFYDDPERLIFGSSHHANLLDPR
jgi:hypothetical protein